MKFTVENSEFFNTFYNNVFEYAELLHGKINSFIKEDPEGLFVHFFKQKEIALLLLMNKSFFQNVYSFFELNKKNLYFSSFNCLRTAIENMRLTRVFYLYDDFRKEYSNNTVYSGDEPEYRFMQKQIIKKLEQEENELRSQDKIPLCSTLLNHRFTKNSAISRCYSELSKWIHLLNSNLLLSTIRDRIDLSLEMEATHYMQEFVLKYTECVYIMLSLHSSLFIFYDKELSDKENKVHDLYSNYIKLVYKN